MPLVTTFYGIDMSKLPREDQWKQAYQQLFAEGDLFLVEGPHMRECLLALGCPPDRVEIQRIAIDLKRVPFQIRRLEPGDTVRILFCGSFREKKGLPYAIQAFALVHAEYPNTELRIIGDGPLRPMVESLIGDLGLSDRVHLLGYQSYNRFVDELSRAHIMVVPSVTAADGDSEGGAPTVLLEAQASGLPVVASYHADIPYVVREGESALLAPERDVQSLAMSLLCLIRDPEQWAKMGQAGRRWVEERHDIRREVKRLEERYNQLLAVGRVPTVSGCGIRL